MRDIGIAVLVIVLVCASAIVIGVASDRYTDKVCDKLLAIAKTPHDSIMVVAAKSECTGRLVKTP